MNAKNSETPASWCEVSRHLETLIEEIEAVMSETPESKRRWVSQLGAYTSAHALAEDIKRFESRPAPADLLEWAVQRLQAGETKFYEGLLACALFVLRLRIIAAYEFSCRQFDHRTKKAFFGEPRGTLNQTCAVLLSDWWNCHGRRAFAQAEVSSLRY